MDATLALTALFAFLLSIVGVLLYLVIKGWRRRGANRYVIMAAGSGRRATVLGIEPRRRGQVLIRFGFTNELGGPEIVGRQLTSPAALQALHLQVGSGINVRCLPAHPRWAFSDALVRAERDAERRTAREDDAQPAALFFVSYSDPSVRAETAQANNLRWYGAGELEITPQQVCFRARKLFSWRPVTHRVAWDSIVDVEQFGAIVRLHLGGPGRGTRRLALWALNEDEASRIAQALPTTRTPAFAPAMAEGVAFLTALATVTPRVWVTPVLIGLNVLVFALATLRGGGFLVSDPAAMIALGTDYTPLTLGGQWWRLLTSVFLHFGLLHLGLNMWALHVNGTIAERLYGSTRFAVIYLVAGLSGSVASLLWHPLVNGAGASGAIFGVLGALMAFFVVRRAELSPSVFKAHLNGTAAFVFYNLVLGARGGIDNAAHLGGLIGGFLVGLMLTRPLTVERHARSWTLQWAQAGAVITVTAIIVGGLLSTGRLVPRAMRDAHGRSIPTGGIAVTTQTLRGVTLGMTAEQRRAAKGEPIHGSTERQWLYNSVDARHDGLIIAWFGKPGTAREGRVDTIEYFGNQESAPPELPFLRRLSLAELTQRYGEPASRVPFDGGLTYVWFRNGIYAGLRDDAVDRYGIFDYRTVNQD